MILKELFTECIPERVADKLMELYPCDKKVRNKYIDTINMLKLIEPNTKFDKNEGQLTVYVCHLTDIFDEDGSCEGVSGYSPKQKTSYSCEFAPFSVWLAMNVAEPSLKHYGIDAFLAHVLWEMTFISFDEADIKKESDYLKNVSDTLDSIREKTKANIELSENEKNMFVSEDDEFYKKFQAELAEIDVELPSQEEVERNNKINTDEMNRMLGI